MRRHAWLILIIVTLSTLLTDYLLRRQVPVYQADALIRLPVGATDGAGESSNRRNTPALSQSKLLQLRGQSVLGPVVDREGLRLIDPENAAPAPFVSDVQIDLAPESAATIELELGRSEVLARTEGAEARADYHEPLVLDSIRFTVMDRPDEDEWTLQVIPRTAAVGMMAARISGRSLEREGLPDVLEIAYVSTDRSQATRVLDEVIAEFQRVNSATAREQLTRQRQFLEQQLQETDSLFHLAQERLIEFRSREQVFSSRDKFAAQQGEVGTLEARISELSAQARALNSLAGRLRNAAEEGVPADLGALAAQPEITSNPVISQLLSERMRHATVRDSLMQVAGRPESDLDVRRLATLIVRSDQLLLDAARSQYSLVNQELGRVRSQRASAAAELERLPIAEAEEVRLMQQVSTLQRIGDDLRTQYQQARLAEAVEIAPVEVLRFASITSPSSSNRAFKLLLGVGFGLLLGCGAALFLESSNSSIRRPQEIQTALQIPELAVIPRAGHKAPPQRFQLGDIPLSLLNGHGIDLRRLPLKKLPLKPADEAQEAELESADANASAASTAAHNLAVLEAYRMLRTNVTLGPAGGHVRVIAVTSPESGDGKSSTAANLAISFAQQGLRVVLVDGDLWHSRLAKVTGVPASPGLTDFLQGTTSLEQCIHATEIENFWVLASGSRPSHASELLSTGAMDGLLHWLRGEFDVVIMDTPPILAVADAAVLCAKADGVIFVVRAGRTNRAAAQAGVRQLSAVGARIIGGVLNDPDALVQGYGGYDNPYGRHYAEVG